MFIKMEDVNYVDSVLKRRKRHDSIESGIDGSSPRSLLAPSPVGSVGTPQPTPDLTYRGIKLGWIQGVLIPCLLNIWGVMLFLRVAWVVAQAGIGLTLLIIFISSVVCIITTLALSAICTNGEVQGGGVYFLVSRSLGAEMGASVGIIFAFANAVAASMNTIGFCDSLNDLLKSHNLKIFDNGPNDTRIVGTIAILVMCLICAIGMDWETKTQNLLITIIVAAILNYIVGAVIGPRSNEAKAQGFAGLNLDIASQNWKPDFRFSEGVKHNFFSVFAVYFPAVTGVQAGANICGDLKDPATAIPKGTLLALAISITSYLAMAALSGVGALRDASGDVNDLTKGTLGDCKPDCPYGLHNNYQIMHLMALYGHFTYGGCWAATLSTALTNLLSVPRLIQALGSDRIYPGLIFFSKRYGKHGEPYRGYVLVFLISTCFLLIADLNTIAPLITNFYLASYALINFCTFHAAFIKPISWRPRFRYYNTWLSLAGCILCVAIMMIISWLMALLTTFIFISLYLVVLYRKPETSWGSSTDAQRYQETIGSILRMSHGVEPVKSFNPQLLVLSGKPAARPWLIDLAGLITKVGSFMIVADICSKRLTTVERHIRRSIAKDWLYEQKFRAFYILLQDMDLERGVLSLLQASGLGYMTPNVMFMGHKYDWDKCSHPELAVYYRIIRLAFHHEMAVAILRVPTHMRPHKGFVAPDPSTITFDEPAQPTHAQSVLNSSSDVDLETIGQVGAYEDEATEENSKISMYQMLREYLYNFFVQAAQVVTDKLSRESSAKRSNRSLSLPLPQPRKVPPYRQLTFNHTSVLDAWWLYDDGGMNILLPYIIAYRSYKEKMSLRIFALPRSRRKRNEAEKRMINLLKKLRIEYSELTLVTGIGDKPSDETWRLFHSILKDHKCSADDETLVSDAEAMRLHEKTCRQLRLRELIIQNSFGADLIVMTLPFPRQGLSAAMYMAWLEMMSRDMPPTLFVRGNSTVVIDS